MMRTEEYEPIVFENACEMLLMGYPATEVAEYLKSCDIPASVEDGDKERVRLGEWRFASFDSGAGRSFKAANPEELAEELLDDEEIYCDDTDRPCTVTVRIQPLYLTADGFEEGGESRAWSRALLPREPECTENEHVWITDGPECGTFAGPNGGVTVIDRCQHCDLVRILTTRWQAADGEIFENVYQYEEPRSFYSDAV